MLGWKKALAKYLPFNLAAFLSVATPTTWFTQAVWYADDQGFYTCPDAPTTCAAPEDFYADYLRTTCARAEEGGMAHTNGLCASLSMRA